MSKYGIFFWPRIFPHSEQKKTPYLDTFHAVLILLVFFLETYFCQIRLNLIMVECLKERMCMMGSQTVISSIGDYKNSDLMLMFIPGNPGVIGFYDVFFEELYRLLKVPIVGISHGGNIT